MKTRSTSNLGLVAMAFLLATAVTTTAADLADLEKAKVVRIKGSARFTTGAGSWQPLKVGDILTPGTVIQTAADSRVDLVLGDPQAKAIEVRSGLTFGSATPGGEEGGEGGESKVDQNFIRLMENTVLAVDTLDATDTGADVVTDTQLDLRAGRIFATVKKLSGGSRYEIKIPNGVAGVRGTILSLDASGLLRVWKEGAVALAVSIDDEMRTQLVVADQQYDPATDTLSALTPTQMREMSSYLRAAASTRPGPPPWAGPPWDPGPPPWLDPGGPMSPKVPPGGP